LREEICVKRYVLMDMFGVAEKVARKVYIYIYIYIYIGTKDVKMMISIVTHTCEHMCERKYIHMDVKM